MAMSRRVENSEVASVPRGWDEVAVGALASFSSGQGIQISNLQEYSSDFPIPVYGGNGIAGYTKAASVHQATVVIGRVGQKCGEVYLTNGPSWITDNALYPTRIDPSVNIHFFALALAAAGLNDVKNRNDLPLVTQSILHSVRIPWPRDVREQAVIVAAIHDFDALIEEINQLIAKKRDIKLGAMQQLLSGKIRLSGFSGEWRAMLLGQLGTFGKGKGIPKDEVLPEGLPCIRYGEIYTHHSDYIRRFYSFTSPGAASQSQRLRRGDILFAASGETAEDIGKCVAFLGEEEAYAGGDIVILHPFQQYSMFLGYLLNSPVAAAQKARMAQGDVIVHIGSRQLGSLRLAVPQENEQRAIAQCLNDMDAELACLEARRDKARLLKQGMMQELLSGRTRLA